MYPVAPVGPNIVPTLNHLVPDQSQILPVSTAIYPSPILPAYGPVGKPGNAVDVATFPNKCTAILGEPVGPVPNGPVGPVIVLAAPVGPVPNGPVGPVAPVFPVCPVAP